MSIAGTPFELVDVDDVWPEFEQRARRSRAPAEVVARQVDACRSGDALCIAGPDGIVILSIECEADGTINTIVRMAVSRGEHGAFGRCEQAMVEITRDLKAKELTFLAYRRGWGRLLGAPWSRTSEFGFSRGV